MTTEITVAPASIEDQVPILATCARCAARPRRRPCCYCWFSGLTTGRPP